MTSMPLNRVGNAHAGAVGNRFVSDIFSVEKDRAGGRSLDAGDEPCQRGLAAAVGAGYDNEFVVWDRHADVADDLDLLMTFLDVEADVLKLQHSILLQCKCCLQ